MATTASVPAAHFSTIPLDLHSAVSGRYFIISLLYTFQTGYSLCSHLPLRRVMHHHADSRRASFALPIASFALVISSAEGSIPASLLLSCTQSASCLWKPKHYLRAAPQVFQGHLQSWRALWEGRSWSPAGLVSMPWSIGFGKHGNAEQVANLLLEQILCVLVVTAELELLDACFLLLHLLVVACFFLHQSDERRGSDGELRWRRHDGQARRGRMDA